MPAFDRARDPNDSTFYVLRYAHDFGAGESGDAPFARESAPSLSAELFHDADRHVTELRPGEPAAAQAPLPGLAVAPDGVVFHVDRHGVLQRRACDGSEAPFPCETGVLRKPAGLALDRRGWLYVADPPAGQIVVLDTRSGAAVQRLAAGAQPVDVAVAASGFVFAADRAGRIWRFSPSLQALGSFEPRNAAGLPAEPRPIAVMSDAAGQVLVADARHPRLLRFTPAGLAQGDVEVSAVLTEVPARTLALDTLRALYGQRRPVFLAAPGCDCPPSDGTARLAAVHLALRVARLGQARAFNVRGVFVSRRLDGGAPAMQWHKIVLDAALPAGSAITVETASAEDPTQVPEAWDAPRDALGRARPFAEDLPDQLVMSPPGRYLWLRVTLTGNGRVTPSLRALRASYPRNSPLELLPAFWQRDAATQAFLQRFLALAEHVNTGVESAFENFVRDLHPDAVPAELVDWLGALVDLAFDPSWPLERRRALLAQAMALYRVRGTAEGIRRYVEIYTGQAPVVLESFLQRPGRAPYLGVPGLVLGCNLQLCGCAPDATPDATLYAAHAHRFTVVAPVPDACDAALMRAVIERIVEVNKPAHTVHEVRIAGADAQVGVHDRVGIDLVLGAPEAPAMPAGARAAGAPARGSVLGRDSVLGDSGSGFLGSRFGSLGGEL